ncbi:CYAC3 protein, partial [Arenaria interpres]|nr:CYAC3 protein [Arenaria interpres]
MLDLPFLPFCAFLGGLGFVCVAFVSAWCQHWRGGFALDGSAKMFNWHPVLMVTGMVVLYGAAALVYRLPPAWRGPKFPWKVLHGALALAAFLLAVLGLVAVFRFHNDHGTPNMYSLHSWVGLATVLLFSCQVGAALAPRTCHLLTFPCPIPLCLSPSHLPSRRKLLFPLLPRKNGTIEYKLLPAEAVFANTLGLLILLFGVLVLGALARPSWKRPDADSPDSRQ